MRPSIEPGDMTADDMKVGGMTVMHMKVGRMKVGVVRAGVAACTTWLGAAACAPARAQLLMRYLPQSVPGYQLDPTSQVLQNGGPDYRSPGIRLGNFILHPALDETFSYNSNPLGFSQARGSPEIDSSASAAMSSDWSRDAVGLSASVDDQRYTALPIANQTNASVFSGGRLDLGRDSLEVSAGYVSSNLSPTDVLTRGLSAPVPYRSEDLRAAFSALLNRWTLVPSVDFTSYRFGTASAGQGFVNDTALDKNQVTGGMTINYELAPGRNLVAAIQEAAAFLLHSPAGQGGNRYFDTLALAGLDFDTLGPFRYDILLGWEMRQDRGHSRSMQQTPALEASVTWRPTLLTTVNAAATRHMSDASYDVTSNLAYSEGKLTLSHELYRNVILQADLDVQATDGDPLGGARVNVSAGAGATWLLSRMLRLNLFYDYSHGFAGNSPSAVNLFSNAAFYNTGGYTSHTIQLSVHFGY